MTEPSVERAVREAAARLSRVRGFEGGARLTVPVLYPSGAMVSVTVSGGPDRFLVTDGGGAAREAETMGAAASFARQGRRAADRLGIRLDDNLELFEADATGETLPGLIALVAEASRLAAQLTSDQLAERLDREASGTLARRLSALFGEAFERDRHEIVGASSRAWRFDALVRGRDGLMAFNAVTPAATSVASAYLKFDDVRRIENAPTPVAVLIRREAFSNESLVMLGRTARIFDAAEPDSELLRLAA
ncbi:hypothetical protein [Methylorubrum sp. SB2]|uniref:hypothetical protein n=1 Tax=Methylorubrum subtropicum TaxID=3138812 RepID=UPI00313E6366